MLWTLNCVESLLSFVLGTRKFRVRSGTSLSASVLNSKMCLCFGMNHTHFSYFLLASSLFIWNEFNFVEGCGVFLSYLKSFVGTRRGYKWVKTLTRAPGLYTHLLEWLDWAQGLRGGQHASTAFWYMSRKSSCLLPKSLSSKRQTLLATSGVKTSSLQEASARIGGRWESSGPSRSAEPAEVTWRGKPHEGGVHFLLQRLSGCFWSTVSVQW